MENIPLIFYGFGTSLGLIAAIGSQNTFVIKQGLLKDRIFLVCSLCLLCDVLLINLGIFGLGEIIIKSEGVMKLIQNGGVIMLTCYALKSFKSAYAGQSSLNVRGKSSPKTIKKIIAMTLAFTLLNPHVYIDTVVIMGGIAGQLTTKQKCDFVIGAMMASGIWFFGIGYGASRVASYFQKTTTWRVLDLIIGVIMVKMSWNLYHGF